MKKMRKVDYKLFGIPSLENFTNCNNHNHDYQTVLIFTLKNNNFNCAKPQDEVAGRQTVNVIIIIIIRELFVV